jgi:hypothetical protein
MAGQDAVAHTAPSRWGWWRRVLRVVPSVLLAAALLLWPLSYWRQLSFHHQPDEQRRVIVLFNGSHNEPRIVDLWHSSSPYSVACGHGGIQLTYWTARSPAQPAPQRAWGGVSWFEANWIDATGRRRAAVFLDVECWLLAIIFAVPVAAQVVRFVLTHRRADQGRCPSCGYDLRATPNRCFECGRATSTYPEHT